SGTLSTRNGQGHLDLELKNLVTSRTALLDLLPAGTISPEVLLPDELQYNGGFSGSSFKQFTLNGIFKTTFGNINANVKIEPVQQFSGRISLQHFDLGKLLKQEKMLGQATGNADFKGKGIKKKTMHSHYEA